MTHEHATLKDSMSRDVISAHPEMPLLEASSLIASHNFDGVPVTDKEGKLIGMRKSRR